MSVSSANISGASISAADVPRAGMTEPVVSEGGGGEGGGGGETTDTLTLTGMLINTDLNRSYSELAISGNVSGSFPFNFQTNDNYKVFGADAGGGTYYIVYHFALIDTWFAAECTVNPSTLINGQATSSIFISAESITNQSETRDGKSAPASSDSKVSYS